MRKNEMNIVLIADHYNLNGNIKIDTDNLEMANEEYYLDVYNGLSTFCNSLTTYDNPQCFLRNIHKHKNDIVLSIWSGTKSRSRKGLIPAICEAYGIKYVGSDCYVQILCQDKSMAKQYCSQFGVKTPKYKILSRSRQKIDFYELKLPLIVKPLFEGGSIGISEDNLVFDYSEAQEKCKDLLNYYDTIMIEEYLDGYELCVILFGNQKTIKVRGASMIKVNGDSYLKNYIWGYEDKKANAPINRIKTVNAMDLLKKEDWDMFDQIFYSLGKVDLIRIDGRINEKGFNLIELSPDPHIGKGASVAEVFKYNNIDYVSMLRMLIENTL